MTIKANVDETVIIIRKIQAINLPFTLSLSLSLFLSASRPALLCPGLLLLFAARLSLLSLTPKVNMERVKTWALRLKMVK